MQDNEHAYELGEEITPQVQVRKPAGIVVSTRLERSVADELLARSEVSGKSLSQLVREAVLRLLDEEPDHSFPHAGAHIGMGTTGGDVSAVFTMRNTVVTNSALVDHTERLLKVD